MKHGQLRADGATAVVWNGVHSGWLLPTVNTANNPAIQSWSKKAGSGMGDVRLQDGGASILSFSDAWATKHQRTYPFADPMGTFLRAASALLRK